MHVLSPTAEVAPYSKAGGLADVAGALPPAYARRGHENTILSPYYRVVAEQAIETTPGPTGRIQMADRVLPYRIHEFQHPNIPTLKYWFLENDQLYDRGGIYTDSEGEGYADNNLRFLFLQRVALDLLQTGALRVDLVHCHDHHTALLPLLLKTHALPLPTLYTVHSFIYQGQFSQEEASLLPAFTSRALTLNNDHYNALHEGLRHACRVNTVSPTYARELLAGQWIAPELHDLLLESRYKFSGILNGIDDGYWNPAQDQYLEHHYDAEDLSGKTANKQALQKQVGLQPRQDALLFGSISRLVENKGFSLILEIMEAFINEGCQFVFLGSGAADIRDALRQAADKWPEAVAFDEGYNEPLAHLIEAGADAFLMPSQIEPCGLNQLYSLRYGTLPIVHRTGGLADTVENWDGKRGTGFVFDEYTPAALKASMQDALSTYRAVDPWHRLIQNAMARDHSWDSVALEYENVYLKLKEDC